MINIKDFDDTLKKAGNGYFIEELQYVPDIMSWASAHKKPLSEPHNPMKLITSSKDSLSMVIQEQVTDEFLEDVIKNLSVRWAVRDNATDMYKKFDSIKKRLVYCFFKEYARALEKTDGDELVEDEWVIEEMEYLGYFNE